MERQGNLLAEILMLEKNKNGRYDTTWGDKTAIGLYKTVIRIVKDGYRKGEYNATK